MYIITNRVWKTYHCERLTSRVMIISGGWVRERGDAGGDVGDVWSWARVSWVNIPTTKCDEE